MSYLDKYLSSYVSLPALAASRKLMAACAVILFLALSFGSLTKTATARAQGLAEEHTVLYYLLEMQRRQDKTCQGADFPLAPSVTPSSILLEAAEEIASGTPLTEALSKRGLDYSQMLVATTTDGSAQEAFAKLKQQYCPFIMKDDYLYVGAARSNGQWVLLMSPTEGSGMPTDPDFNGYAPPDAEQAYTPPAPEPGVEPLPDPNPEPAAPAAVAGPIPPAHSVASGQPQSALKNDPLLNIRHKDASDYTASSTLPQPQSSNPDSVPPDEIIHEAAPSPVQKLPPVPAGQVDPSRLEPFVPRRPIGLSDQEAMAAFIDQVRVRGYMCGNTFMQPAPGLAYNQALAAAAQRHAEDMAARNFFSSTSPNGGDLAGRVSATSYQYHDLGELLGRASPPVERILLSWLANPRQCSMIMNPAFTDIGGGYETRMHNFVIIFGSPELIDSPAPRQ